MVIALTNATPAAETPKAAPLVPIVSFLSHWDHHWYIWLSGDPVYEAVEVMASDRGAQGPLVWAFFTERAPPKHQAYYYNDPAVAAARGGTFTPIKFVMSGRDGAPRGVTVGFDDSKGRAVAIDVAMDANAELSTKGAGLTNQIGHSEARLLLVFFRERAAYASNSSVAIDGVDVSKPRNGYSFPAPFPTAYSSNIYVGGLPFGALDVSFKDAGHPGAVANFKPGAEPGVFEAHGGELRLVAADDGKLVAYQQRDRTKNHVMEIKFDPPVPSAWQLVSLENRSNFRISLDQFENLLSGEVRLRRDAGSVTLDWYFDEPAWARARLLRTSAVVDDNAVSHLEVKPIRRE
jgi:hypothetical protein